MVSAVPAWLKLFSFFLALLFEAASGQIFYPNAGSINDFRVGDKVIVSLVNPYASANLALYCSYKEIPLFTQEVASRSTSPITLTLNYPASPNCYLELKQDQNHIVTTPIFSISPRNGTQTTWSSSSLGSDGEASAAVSSAISRVTATASGQPSRAPRPEVTLPDDGPEQDYTLADGTNCLDLTTKDQRCWEALKLNKWLPEWFAETPKCAEGSNSDVNCQSQKGGPEAWTVTFLREYGATWVDCLHLDTLSCGDFPTIGGSQSSLSAARFEYVKSNIIAIAQFLISWHQALDTAAESAAATIEPIIALIDIPKRDKSRLALNVFLTVSGLALSFIPVVGPEVGLGVLSLAALNTAIAGVKQVPDLAKKIWPSGAEDTVDFQTDALKILFTGPSGLRTQLNTNFADILSVVQGLNQPNTDAFLAFAGQGIFSVPTTMAPTVKAASPEQKRALVQSMTTFLVSVALAQNGWQALILPGVDAEGLHNGNTACPQWAGSECSDDKHKDLGCQGHEATGQCQDTYWWYSVEQKSMYTLVRDGELTDDATALLQTIISPNTGWTTGSLLFENAARCQLQNMLIQAKIQPYTYTSVNEQAGFQYTTSIIDLVPYQSPYGSDFFISIAGPAFVALSRIPKYHDAQFHPVSNPFVIQPDGGIDASCVSNLNVSIANSWNSEYWVGNNSW